MKALKIILVTIIAICLTWTALIYFEVDPPYMFGLLVIGYPEMFLCMLVSWLCTMLFMGIDATEDRRLFKNVTVKIEEQNATISKTQKTIETWEKIIETLEREKEALTFATSEQATAIQFKDSKIEELQSALSGKDLTIHNLRQDVERLSLPMTSTQLISDLVTTEIFIPEIKEPSPKRKLNRRKARAKK